MQTIVSAPRQRIGIRRSQSADVSVDHRVEIVAVVGALVAMFLSSSAPTGFDIVDAVYRGLFAGGVVTLAATARRWTWSVLAGGAAVVTASLLGQVVALVALVVAVGAARSSRRRVVGAAIAAVCMPALLAQGVGPFGRLTGGLLGDTPGTSAVLTVAIIGPACVSGWKRLPRGRRSTVRRWTRRAVVAALVSAGVALVALAASAPSIRSGLDASEQAAGSGGDGDLETATVQLENAAASWRTASSRLGGPWMLPSRLVPILGQHVRAAQIATGQAAALTESASVVTGRLEPDAIVANGRVDLNELDSLTPAMDALAGTVSKASERFDEAASPWLISPVGARLDEVADELRPASGILGSVAGAMHVSRDLLGSPDGSTIVVMFSTPAEARGSGGFVGNWAEFRSVDGEVELVEQYRSKELNDALERVDASLRTDADYTARYGRFAVERHVQDVTLSPDFPSVARTAADLYSQATGRSVDAMLMIDPFVLEALLAFTGPVDVDGLVLSGANASDELLRGQYEQFAEDDDERTAVLDLVAATVVERLLEEPPDPIAFVQELAPLAEAGRLTLWFADDSDGEIVETLGVSGAFPEVQDDVLAVVHQNGGQNKIDTMLDRSVSIATTLSPSTSRVHHEVSVVLSNEAPPSGLPPALIGSNDQGLPLGTNWMTLSVYSALPVRSVTVDGTPVAVESQREFGVHVHSVQLALAPESVSSVVFDLEGSVPFSDTFTMDVPVQPLSRPDDLQWTLRTDDGTAVAPPASWSTDDGAVAISSMLEQPQRFDFVLSP